MAGTKKPSTSSVESNSKQSSADPVNAQDPVNEPVNNNIIEK
jgi:hypothetical protein